MSIISTKRHSNIDTRNIQFGSAKSVLPHLAKDNRKDNLDKAKSYLDKAAKSRTEADLLLNTGNAIVCLKRIALKIPTL